jgi:hypothetical protein
MTRLEAWLFHSSNALVAATGLVYAWMAYLLEPDDPYAIVNHPLQPATQHLHVLVAPALVFMGGVLWQRHAWGRLRSGARARRRSGLSLIAALAPMVLSGYLIQTASSPSWRAAWVAVHLATSALWIAGSLVHVARRRATEREGAGDQSSAPAEPSPAGSGSAASPAAASGTLG